MAAAGPEAELQRLTEGDMYRRYVSRSAYLDIQGLDFEAEVWAAACSRWNRPPRGALGRAAIAACFRRKAFCIGVSSGGGASALSGTGLVSNRGDNA